MSSAVAGTGDEDVSMATQQKRRWIKYYCEECKAWETREMFEVAKLGQGGVATQSTASPPGSSALWSWGCSKLVRHATFQTFRVQELNDADGHDAAPKLDFPSTESPASTEPVGQVQQPTHPGNTEATEEVSALQTVHAASQSNGSSQSKRPKRNVRSAYARDSVTDQATSPVNSQGGVTSSSPDEVVPDENGASTVHVKNNPKVTKNSKDSKDSKDSKESKDFKDTKDSKDSKDGEAATAAADTSVLESPAVIDAEHHENGVHKRPRRLTAGDRYLAQALQDEKPSRAAAKPLAEVNDVKPSQSSLEMKRPKRVTAGLRGAVLSAENAKSSPSPRVLAKKEEKKDAVHEVRTRSETAKKPSKKNRKLGDLY
ncbi:hypothetical protein M758_8G033500 [Ceratodon purpureus]|nr:hypothetical protein M758_8G033500 [Ceratodon purpureus]